MPTKIEWTGESWNPIRARRLSDGKVGWHCEHASPGCEHCYAETRNVSGRCNLGTRLPFKPGHRKDVEVFLDETALLKPLGWKKGRKVFVCSMTDLFADFVTDAMIDRIFAVMALCPQHTFQVLTKRSARMREYLAARDCRDPANPITAAAFEITFGARGYRGKGGACSWPLPNVWLGVSVEDQQRADERIPDLLATPAAVRWISAEPLLGPVNIIDAMWARDVRLVDDLTATLDWVVVGGESGPGARPMHPDWARSLRDQCAAADVPFFFKQWGEWVAYDEDEHDGSPLDPTGAYGAPGSRSAVFWPKGSGPHTIIPAGKKRAGRLLDGVEHNGMPGQANA